MEVVLRRFIDKEVKKNTRQTNKSSMVNVIIYLASIASFIAIIIIWNHISYPVTVKAEDLQVEVGPNYYGKIVPLQVTCFNSLTRNRVELPIEYAKTTNPWIYLTKQDEIYDRPEYIDILPLMVVLSVNIYIWSFLV